MSVCEVKHSTLSSSQVLTQCFLSSSWPELQWPHISLKLKSHSYCFKWRHTKCFCSILYAFYLKKQLLLQSSVSHNPSEIVLICWFAAEETFRIINVENCWKLFIYVFSGWIENVYTAIQSLGSVRFFLKKLLMLIKPVSIWSKIHKNVILWNIIAI